MPICRGYSILLARTLFAGVVLASATVRADTGVPIDERYALSPEKVTVVYYGDVSAATADAIAAENGLRFIVSDSPNPYTPPLYIYEIDRSVVSAAVSSDDLARDLRERRADAVYFAKSMRFGFGIPSSEEFRLHFTSATSSFTIDSFLATHSLIVVTKELTPKLFTVRLSRDIVPWRFTAPMVAESLATARKDLLISAYPHYYGRGEWLIAEGLTAVSSTGLETLDPKLDAYPNPFNASVAIRYRLGNTEPASLSVYSIDGVAVRTLFSSATMSAGTHSYTWDGTDATGRRVASGAYVVRLSTPSGEATIRFSLVR